MPLGISGQAPVVLIRRQAFERAGLLRSELDARLGLTPDEFAVEGDLVLVGPLFNEDAVGNLTEWLEEAGLSYYDDFFDLSGNWPDWLRLFAMG
jgi:hypothetical protein